MRSTASRGPMNVCQADGSRILCCSSRHDVRLAIYVAEFADVSSACSSLDDTTVVLTAARDKSDVADVKAKLKGNYRAYRLSSRGLEQLTDEYTNSAIPLGNEGLAYSNGKGLVVIKNGHRSEHKAGPFNWGPPSISTNEDGSLLAMVRWKGDNKKLLICETDSQRAHTSSFSLYSYVLAGRAVYYELRREVRLFLPETGETTSVTNAAFKRSLLNLCKLTQFEPANVHFGFSNLSVLDSLPIVNVQIADPDSFEPHSKVIVSIGSDGNPAAILMTAPQDGDWRIQTIQSIGNAVRLSWVALKAQTASPNSKRRALSGSAITLWILSTTDGLLWRALRSQILVFSSCRPRQLTERRFPTHRGPHEMVFLRRSAGGGVGDRCSAPRLNPLCRARRPSGDQRHHRVRRVTGRRLT